MLYESTTTSIDLFEIVHNIPLNVSIILSFIILLAVKSVQLI